MMYPEGTYLIWLNFSEFGLTDDKSQNKLIYKGNVLLNSSINFGTEGSQYMRLNVACPKVILYEGLERIKKAFI